MFTANVNYIYSGGGEIGGFSALTTTIKDSLIIYSINASCVSTRLAGLRYNTGSSFLASLTFTAPSGTTSIKAEFLPGNTSLPVGYGYYVDNLRLARMTGTGFYTSDFVTGTIVSQNTDGWSTNWATSYMNVLTGSPNKLRVSGESPNISRNFTVTSNDACAFSYTQSENNSVSLIIEQSPNGTSGWSTLMNITSVNGTHVRNFTPTQAYVRVRMSGSLAFSLADVTLKSTHVDMMIVEIPGKGGYRYSFQGQEHDDEIKGAGNSVNYTFRMHDPRLGRFLSIDPLTAKYPHYTPYSFSGNRVINAVELEGKEEFIVIGTPGSSVAVNNTTAAAIAAAVQGQSPSNPPNLAGLVNDPCGQNFVVQNVKIIWDPLARDRGEGGMIQFQGIDGVGNQMRGMTPQEVAYPYMAQRLGILSESEQFNRIVQGMRTRQDSNGDGSTNTTETATENVAQVSVGGSNLGEGVCFITLMPPPNININAGFNANTANVNNAGVINCQLQIIANYLTANNRATVTLTGNVSMQGSNVNTMNPVAGMTAGQLATARATAIGVLLQGMGVNANQINTNVGNTQGANGMSVGSQVNPAAATSGNPNNGNRITFN